ncbi:hypothetical protein [Methylobacterium sp. ID0610]|uniref:hypothetical protein n=1 Tax=Methylobacterium carpenticola TaxID=3344827 RepID=UPI0036D20794
MSETLTPRRGLILWCLLGRQGRALQSEIRPKIQKLDREALIENGYLAAAKQGRSLRLTVTDKGWRWAGEHLRDPLPDNARVLQDWLGLIHRHLDATGATLADLIGQAPEPEPVAKAPAARSAAKRPKPPGPQALRTRIEAAYLALTEGRKSESVRLSRLRAELADLDRATVDAGLARILAGDKTARLGQITDPRAIDAAEREAAFSPAGEAFHLLWIQA